MNKNLKKLESFTKYCLENKNQRFWQALKNWNQIENPEESFILVSDTPLYQMEGSSFLIEDTFYRE